MPVKNSCSIRWRLLTSYSHGHSMMTCSLVMFNAPYGACPDCDGTRKIIDAAALIDPKSSVIVRAFLEASWSL